MPDSGIYEIRSFKNTILPFEILLLVGEERKREKILDWGKQGGIVLGGSKTGII